MSTQQIEPVKVFGATGTLKDALNRAPVLIEHTLNDHPLLSLEAVATLAKRFASQPTPRGFFMLPTGEATPGKWGSTTFQKAVAAGFDNMASSEMRLKLSSIHLEPGYRELLRLCANELDARSGGVLLRGYPEALATLFVSAPGQITPYHIDSETNFLFQIVGTKTVHIFDGTDRSLIGIRELERYWGTGRIEMPKGIVGWDFELKPGVGVHNPVHFPHWVENGPSPSISLSIAFSSRRDLSEVFRVNHQLRRLGFSPTEPGSNLRLDDAKRAALRSALAVQHFLKHGTAARINLR